MPQQYGETATIEVYFMLGLADNCVTLRSINTEDSAYWDEVCLGSETIELTIPQRSHQDICAQGIKKYEADKTTLQAETQGKLNILDEKIAQLLALPNPEGSV